MLTEYPNLSRFLEKHRLAQNSNAKEVRYTMIELNDTVHDLHKLMASVTTKHEDYTELKKLLSDLTVQLQELTNGQTDGGDF